MSTDYGISKKQFEDFFCEMETHSYEGFKWEWSNTVRIYELVGGQHEIAARAFGKEIGDVATVGG